MTRRRRHGASTAGKTEAESEDKTERIAVFEKTKMCKFHILGVCMKGDACRFAHEKGQLQALPDLQRTKLCKTLINTGQCDNPQCKYAHNKDELRPLPEMDTPQDLKLKEPKPQQSGSSTAAMPVGPVQGTGQTAQAAQEAAALFRPGGPLAQYGQPLENMPTSQKQAAIQQMGQVAQAHAAEAARLHTMAMFLHAHMNGQSAPGGVPDQAALQQFLNQQGQGQTPDTKAASADAAGGDGQGGSTRTRTDSDYARVHQSATSADSASMVAAAMSRVLPNEPVHINPRSLSCNSLSSLGGFKDDKEEMLPGDADDLNHANANSEAKHVLTYAASSQQGTPSPEHGRDPLAMAFTSVKDVMTVKNTFLDFGPHTPVSQALRSVQTASGRLDLMTQTASE